jgi:serine protease Do
VVVDDAALDLALLRVRAPLPPHSVVLGDSDAIVVGERVVALGNPFGLEHTLTDGLVSARRVLDGRKWVQISAPISRGNSGGPLFNARGEVVAVNTATFNPMLGAQNLNLAVPINDLKPLIERAHRAASGKRSASW